MGTDKHRFEEMNFIIRISLTRTLKTAIAGFLTCIYLCSSVDQISGQGLPVAGRGRSGERGEVEPDRAACFDGYRR